MQSIKEELQRRIGNPIKVIWEHCGRKQKAKEINYSLNYVDCKFCGKKGSLRGIKKI